MNEQPSLLSPGRPQEGQLSGPFLSFATEVFLNSTTNIGVFIDYSILASSTGRVDLTQETRPHQTLTRTATGISLQGQSEIQRSTILPTECGYHLLVIFSGGDDDSFAVRLALQIARNPSVTATIARIPLKAASSSTSDSTPESENASFFFNSCKASLPPDMASRVVFEEPVGGGDVVADTITKTQSAFRNLEKPVQIIIQGRSGLRHEANESIVDQSLLEVLEKTGFEASLLIVQAKKEC